MGHPSRGPDHPDTLHAMHNLGGPTPGPPDGRRPSAVRKRWCAAGRPFCPITPTRWPAPTPGRRLPAARASGPRPRPRRRGPRDPHRQVPDDWPRFHTMSLLGAALAGQEKYAEAKPLLTGGYEGLKARAGEDPGSGPEVPGRRGGADHPPVRGVGPGRQGGRLAKAPGPLEAINAEAEPLIALADPSCSLVHPFRDPARSRVASLSGRNSKQIGRP